MNNFVVEKYLIYVRDIQCGKTIFYIIEKINVTCFAIKRIDNNQKETICISDIEDKFVRENVKEINIKVNLAEIKYATKQLAALLRKETLDIMKYGNVKEDSNISNNRYNIRIVRYYYDPKGRLFERLFNKKW